jgi:hypothetical protein
MSAVFFGGRGGLYFPVYIEATGPSLCLRNAYESKMEVEKREVLRSFGRWSFSLFSDSLGPVP